MASANLVWATVCSTTASTMSGHSPLLYPSLHLQCLSSEICVHHLVTTSNFGVPDLISYVLNNLMLSMANSIQGSHVAKFFSGAQITVILTEHFICIVSLQILFILISLSIGRSLASHASTLYMFPRRCYQAFINWLFDH